MATMQSSDFARLRFAEAAELWLSSRVGVSERTRSDNREHLRRLLPFFGGLRLEEIHIGHVQAYREQRRREVAARKNSSREHPGASRINHELSTLQQILKRAGLWGPLAAWYQPLPLPKAGPGRALAPEQEERLFRLAASRSRWKVAYYCALITANTTAGPGEIRRLRLRDVDLPGRMIYIREGAKNRYRERPLPLNGDAFQAVRLLLERARSKGATEPDHYLLPGSSRRGSGPDPTRPMGSWKRAWMALRKAAGLPGLRMYDLRHHAITRLLENPEVSERTVIELAGHVSQKLLMTYSHVREQARRAAVEALDAKRAPASEPAALRVVGRSGS